MVKTIRYRFAFNECGELVDIKDSQANISYRCPQCGGEMIRRCGKIKEWHFAHKHEECDYNNYLHIIAEYRIGKWYNESSKINIQLPIKKCCQNSSVCKLYEEDNCTKSCFSELYNLKQFFGDCEREVRFQKGDKTFIADLLCRSKINEQEPLFIEICVTHSCEEEKIKSGIRIIEFDIRSESDIDEIIEHPIIGTRNVRFYNFNPKDKLVSPDNFNAHFQKFILYPSKKGHVKYYHSCQDLQTRFGILEITTKVDDIPYFFVQGGFYAVAFAIARRFDATIKTCMLCKYQGYSTFEDVNICRLYKKYGTKKLCSENNPLACEYFRCDKEKDKSLIILFEKYKNSKPVDVWVKKD